MRKLSKTVINIVSISIYLSPEICLKVTDIMRHLQKVPIFTMARKRLSLFTMTQRKREGLRHKEIMGQRKKMR